jgi:hypothetical protein
VCALREKQTVILVLLERQIKEFIKGESSQCIKTDMCLKTGTKKIHYKRSNRVEINKQFRNKYETTVREAVTPNCMSGVNTSLTGTNTSTDEENA